MRQTNGRTYLVAIGTIILVLMGGVAAIKYRQTRGMAQQQQQRLEQLNSRSFDAVAEELQRKNMYMFKHGVQGEEKRRQEGLAATTAAAEAHRDFKANEKAVEASTPATP